MINNGYFVTTQSRAQTNKIIYILRSNYLNTNIKRIVQNR